MTQFMCNVVAVVFWLYWTYVDNYNCSGDIWSIVLVVFAMITFFFLFFKYFSSEHKPSDKKKN